MSDASTSNDVPSDSKIEQALRNAVQSLYKNGNLENLTIKRIRKSVEQDLELPNDFLKSETRWKERSRTVIQSEVDAQPGAEGAPPQPNPEKACHSPPKAFQQQQTTQSTKRSSNGKTVRRKRRKTDESVGDDGASQEDEISRRKKTAKSKARERPPPPSLTPASDDGDHEYLSSQDGRVKLNGTELDLSGIEGSELMREPKRRGKPESREDKKTVDSREAKTTSESPTMPDAVTADKSESELSELIDEAPKQRRHRRSGSPNTKVKKAKVLKKKQPSGEPTDPEAEEIKRLQGWLVKCGIRKIWSKELASYDTLRAKIKHLKAMLTDAGMTGRFSEAKAQQIKEERELKADLEAVQQGDKIWGQAESKEDPSTGRPKRRLAKGFEGLDFLNDDDGEETD